MITVYGIVYNEYGNFIPQWIQYMENQTVKPEMLIVLGKNHGADIGYLKKKKVKYVICDSDNMGELRNKGLEKIKTKFWLYFSIDDELLPNACEEIIKEDQDALSIRFSTIQVGGAITKDCKSPTINNIDDLMNWEKMWGGYVAVKGNTDLRFREDIEVPNLSFHFELFRRGIKTKQSNNILIVHHRRPNSHHFRNEKERKSKIFVVEINKTRDEVLNEVINKAKRVKIQAIQKYFDNSLETNVLRNNEEIRPENNLIKPKDKYVVNIDRAKKITNTIWEDRPLAKIIEIIE